MSEVPLYSKPLPSEEGTTGMGLKTFAIKLARAKAIIWP